MTFALFSMDGLLFLLRWFHFFFGVIWIGHLYYFNFTQGPFFTETDATTKSNVVQKLLPRALWWFRWGAMVTMATGLLMLMIRGHRDGGAIFATSWGLAILTGTALGLLMWANVWFVIWPAQKVVIQSALQVASGGQPIAEAAARGVRAGVASRTNTLFSLPMLFFMGSASHLPLTFGPAPSFGALAAVIGVILLALELNALKGKLGPLTTVKGVIHMGFVLTAVLYVAMELLTK
ncbi:MAG: urate hydroxylase PuuD [Oligoflexia bacterium]|nr:urate hydroxylase PuuD [Oligoflexia bacterium]